jgi:hypothetical protein
MNKLQELQNQHKILQVKQQELFKKTAEYFSLYTDSELKCELLQTQLDVLEELIEDKTNEAQGAQMELF